MLAAEDTVCLRLMNKHYHPENIEPAIQARWDKNQVFIAKEDLNKEKFYCLSMLPYPSGDLHMGHVRNYTIADVIARIERMHGKNVMQPMGWDAFGLPAENAALKHKTAPREWAYKNISEMRTQFQRLGFAIDWSREFATCEHEFYRWEQWLFVQLYKKGLAYRKNALVNWDPVDQTVLANEQVINGCGWRSGAPVERREIPQWFLKITDYADELLDCLDELDGWPEQVRTMQRNWIGRSEGVEFDFAVENHDEKLHVFTTRTDTIMGVTYVAIAPQHPLAKLAASKDTRLQEFMDKCQNIKVAEAEIATLEKEGLPTHLFAIHPITQAKIPIWVANYVLMEYGAGAVMAVPAHDERDFEFAHKYDLPITIVIQPKENWNFTESAFTGIGKMVNSGDFDGLDSEKAMIEIGDYLEDKNLGKRQTNYRLHDWGVSRQRYWGAPIPIIYCEQCGDVPVPEEDLPVVLPPDLVLKNPISPLKSMPDFYETTCPNCKAAAKRETDTFDTFMESSWYYARYCSHDQNQAMLDDRARYWTPVDQYIGGIEHAVMHLLYARFVHKLLRDEGLLNSDEPFTRLMTQGMVLKDGAKMSKSKGNTVSPMALIKKFGADTVRLFSMFAAPPEQSLEWSDSGVEGCYRFLKRLWQFCVENEKTIKSATCKCDWTEASDDVKAIRKELYQILQQANYDVGRQQFNTVVSAGMKILNLASKLNLNEKMAQNVCRESLDILLRLLSPIVPHITEEIWHALKFGDSILSANWPKVDEAALQSATIKLVVQVNGKLRSEVIVPTDASKADIEKLALDDENIKRHTDNKTIRKVIIIPDKLVNIVTN